MIVANRKDGTASRLIALLNAIFLSKKIGDEFRFIWEEEFTDGWTKNRVKDLSVTTGFRGADGKHLGHSLEAVTSVFSQDFISKHFIEEEDIPKESINIAKGFESTQEFLNSLNASKTHTGIVMLGDLNRCIKDIDDASYKNGMAIAWKDIEFAQNIQEIIERANFIARDFGDFVCVHIRSGDAIYDYSDFRKFNRQCIYHATPCEIALEIVNGNVDKKVVLVGDDMQALNAIRESSKHTNCFTMEYFRDIDDLTNLELLFFDVIFMANASLIYGTHSAVARLATFVGNIKFINNYAAFDQNHFYKILIDNFPLLNVSPCQKAFSLFHIFLLSSQQSKTCDELNNILDQALLYDFENDKYRIHKIVSFIGHHRFLEAENYLCEILRDRANEFLDTLFIKSWTGVVFRGVFDAFLKNTNRTYPYICFVASKIYEFQDNILEAIRCIKLSLSSLSNNELFLGYLNDLIVKLRVKIETGEQGKNKDCRKIYNKAIKCKDEWRWNKAIKYYQKSILINNDHFLEYMDFLASIGEFDLLNEMIQNTGYNTLLSLLKNVEMYGWLDKYLSFYDKYFNREELDEKSLVFSVCKDNCSRVAYLKQCSLLIEEYDINQIFCIIYILNKINKKDNLKISDFDMIKFYRFVYKCNKLSTQFLMSKFVKLFFDDIVNDMRLSLTSVADILNLRHSANYVLSQGAIKYRNKILAGSKANLKYEQPKKVAVCLYGCYRANSDKTLKLISENIVKPLKADAFMHTWNIHYRWNGFGGDLVWSRRYLRKKDRAILPNEMLAYDGLKQYFPRVLKKLETPIMSPVDIDKINKIINFKKIKLDTHNNFLKTLKFSPSKFIYIPHENYAPFNVARLNYGMYSSYNLVREYEQLQGISYDYVILVRIDQGYMKTFDVNQLISLGNNEMLCRVLYHGIDERIMAASSETMCKFVNIYKHMLKCQNINIFPHYTNHFFYRSQEMSEYMWSIANDIRIKPLDMSIDIFLPTDGAIPNFYNELKKDLGEKGSRFKDDPKYKELLLFLKNGGGRLFVNIESAYTATDIIKNRLSYGLGQVMIRNSKSLMGLIKMPYVLFGTIKAYRNYIAKKNVLPLHDYPDYLEALKYKKHLSYRLGEALIKAHKSWWKGGYIKFLFEVKKIKEDFNKEKERN